MAGIQVLRLAESPTKRFAAIATTAEVKAALADRGHNASAFNVIRHPLGFSRPLSAELLFDRKTITDIQAAETLDLELGDSDTPLVITEVGVIAIRPLFVGSGGVGLYGVSISDRRHDLLVQTANDGYNLLGRNYRDFSEDSIQLGDVPFTYQQAIEDLAAELVGVSVSYNGVDAQNPSEARTEGMPIPVAIDRLAAEAGRVVVYPRTGNSIVVSLIDAVKVSDVLEGFEKLIMDGGIGILDGLAGGFLDEWKYPSSVISDDIPDSIRGVIAQYSNTTQNDGSKFATIAATFLPASSGLNKTNGQIKDIHFPYFEINGTTGTALDLVNFYAEAFYRRYVAGTMDVMLAGIVDLPLGGGCQLIEWSCDGEHGYTTRAIAQIDWEGYAFPDPQPSPFNCGPMMNLTRYPSGESAVRPIEGYVVGAITAVDNTGGGAVYDFKVEGFPERFGLTPRYRSLGPPVEIVPNPGIVGTSCLCRLTLFGGELRPILILVESEKFAQALCPSPV